MCFTPLSTSACTTISAPVISRRSPCPLLIGPFRLLLAFPVLLSSSPVSGHKHGPRVTLLSRMGGFARRLHRLAHAPSYYEHEYHIHGRDEHCAPLPRVS